MGPTANSLYPVVGLGAVGRTFADLGVPVRVGDGLEAALEVLSETAVLAVP
jgi:pyridoxamine--pyruvate transaminase